jgi:hypothetical protein
LEKIFERKSIDILQKALISIKLQREKRHRNWIKNKNSIYKQGSHYFQNRGRSNFSFRELKGSSGRQQREMGRLLGESRI